MARAPVAAVADDAAPADQTADMTTDDTGAGTDEGAGDQVLVTICKSADGGYTVYAGDEPEEGAEPAEPAEGDEAAASQGQPAESIGAALKAALDILQSDESESGGGQKAFDDGFAGQGNMPAPAQPTGA